MELRPGQRREIEVELPPPPGLVAKVPLPRAAKERVLDRILARVTELTTPAVGGLAWRGQVLKGRFFPGTSQFSVGENVLAKRIGHSTEWAVSKRSAEIIYFSPGGLWPGAWADWHGELWKYDGVNPPEHVWTPTALIQEHPSCLAWYAGTGRLYIWTWGYNNTVDYDFVYRIYKLDPSDDSVALVLEVNLDDEGLFLEDPAMDVAQATIGGIDYLFVHHGWYYEAHIRRFDPNAEAQALVFVYPDAGPLDAYGGGICYHKGSGRLLGFSGYQMYRSLNGLAWVLDKDMRADWDIFDSGPMVYNRDDDKVYLAYEWDNIANQGGIASYNGAAWVREYNYPGTGNGNVGFKGLGNLYNADGTIEMVAGYWAWWFGLDRADVHKKTAGVWGLDWAGPPLNEGWVHTACQTMVTLNSKLLTLLYDRYGVGPTWYGARLYERDLAGAYSVVMSWASYQCWPTHAYTQCMTLARTSKLIHEI